MAIITQKEYLALMDLCQDSVKSSRITEWERQFIDDIQRKLDEFQLQTRISEKQWEIINRIENKVYAI